MTKKLLSISQLAKRFSLSRTTILYYEKQSLLSPTYRCENNYRWYDSTAIEALKTICAYRGYGLGLEQIKVLLNNNNQVQHQILKEHFYELENEIEKLRKQQRAIVVALQEPNLLEENMVNKARWVKIMSEAGFSEQDMKNWHKKFEELEPEEHERFLQSLGIDDAEIARIRAF